METDMQASFIIKIKQFKYNLNIKKHGKGTFYYKDGSYYKGNFHKNKKHGNGIYYT